MGTTVAIPLGTAYLLRPQASGGGGAVQTAADGTTTIEVPNETYDQALDTARKSDPTFGNESVAGSIEGGSAREVPQPEGAQDLVITSVFAPGCSTDCLPTGAVVVFQLQGNPALYDTFVLGSVHVDLEGGGVMAGAMAVQELWMDAGSGAASVTASLPHGLVAPDGTVTAVVKCGGVSSQPVVLGLDPGDVGIVAVQTVVETGGSVQVILSSSCGGRILGALTLTGAGSFLEGGKTIRIDAWATAYATIVTTNPGSIHVTFHQDPKGACASDMNAFFD
jgi:hypothetical protein